MARDWTQDEVIKDLERVIEKQDKEIERLREALSKIAQYDIQAWAIDALAPNSRISLEEDE